MLDTYGRKYVQPGLMWIGKMLAHRDVRPVVLTAAGLGSGVLAAVMLAQGQCSAFLCLLWFSGLLDALDGTVARLRGSNSPLGAFLDIVCDRIVEGALLLVLGWRHPEAGWALLVLSVAIICSLTVFLTSAAALPRSDNKSFHYQVGLAERTEGFLFFSLLGVFPAHVVEIVWIFAAAVLFTAVQRFCSTLQILQD